MQGIAAKLGAPIKNQRLADIVAHRPHAAVRSLNWLIGILESILRQEAKQGSKLQSVPDWVFGCFQRKYGDLMACDYMASLVNSVAKYRLVSCAIPDTSPLSPQACLNWLHDCHCASPSWTCCFKLYKCYDTRGLICLLFSVYWKKGISRTRAKKHQHEGSAVRYDCPRKDISSPLSMKLPRKSCGSLGGEGALPHAIHCPSRSSQSSQSQAGFAEYNSYISYHIQNMGSVVARQMKGSRCFPIV